MSRVLVLLPTSSYRTADFARAAQSIGVELVVGSDADQPLDLGDRFLRLDCHDPEAAARAIVDLADHTPIDAVVAADDAGVIAAALASEKLGLPHHPPEAASATRDKLAMRRLLAAREVPQPAFAPIESPESAPIPFPLVLKPRTATASRGVVRVDSAGELAAAFAEVKAVADEIGEEGPLLAESFVAGAEVAVEGLVSDGRLHVLAVFDKPDSPQGPYFPETLLVTPSSLPADTLSDLERVVADGVTALGLSHGPVHAEARIDEEDRVFLLEVAARSIGGLCGRSLRFGLMGSSLEELILATALGRPQALSRQPQPSGVLMLPVDRRGVLQEVAGVEHARAMAGITEVDITIPPGTPVRPLPDGDRYLGFIFAVGADTAEVTERLRKAAGVIQVVVD